jgi:hypothetical protein
MRVGQAEVARERGDIRCHRAEDRGVVVDEVDLVDGDDDVRHAQQLHDREVPAGLLEHALAHVDEHDDGVGRGRPRDHVARVLHVAGAVGEDERPAPGGEVAIGHVDRDALLALGPQAVGEEGEVDRAGLAAEAALSGGAGDRLELVGEDRLRVVQQAAHERGLAVVDRPGGREAEERRHQKYPSFLRSSMAASERRSSARVAPRSVRLDAATSVTISERVAASDSTAPVQLRSPTVR